MAEKFLNALVAYARQGNLHAFKPDAQIVEEFLTEIHKALPAAVEDEVKAEVEDTSDNGTEHTAEAEVEDTSDNGTEHTAEAEAAAAERAAEHARVVELEAQLAAAKAAEGK